jgi:hypothetical protein
MASNESPNPDCREALERKAQTEFLRRGEAAWQDYLKTGLSVPADEVFARLQAALDAKRAVLVAGGSPSVRGEP